MKTYHVIEIVRNRVAQLLSFDNEAAQQKAFEDLVREYGVEPYDFMVDEGIFEEEGGECVVQTFFSDGLDESWQALRGLR